MNLGKLNAKAGMQFRQDSPGGLLLAGEVRGLWKLTVRDADGNITDVREWENVVTTEGQNYLLATGLDGGAATTTWYVGLTDGTPTVAEANTMASHAGWAEVTAYSQATRVTWTGGTAAAGSIDNVGNEASFSINADSTTVGGAFLVSVNTKGGATGTLYAVGAFSGGDLVLNNGSTLDVTATFTV